MNNTCVASDAKTRVATVDDLDRVIELCVAHAAFEGSRYVPSGQRERLSRAISGNAPRLTIFLAETENSIVGYASVALEYSTWTASEFLHMDCLYICENMRGTGLGRNLFETVHQLAAKLGVPEIQWQTPDWNTAATGFYRSLGANGKNKTRFSFPVSPDQQR